MSRSNYIHRSRNLSPKSASDPRPDPLDGSNPRRKKLSSTVGLLLLVVVILSFSHGCTPAPPPTEQVPPTETIAEPVQQGSVQLDEAVIEHVESISEDETSGWILTVLATNPTSDEIVVTIPCGLIFEPGPESDEQRLMVVQEASATLLPGENAALTPYVVCIDSSNAIPGTGSTYHVGVMATGDLLKLAQCVCNETLADYEMDPMAFMDQFGLQFAVWSVSDELSFEDMFEDMEEAGGALGEIGAEDFGEELGGLLGGVREMFQGFGQEWLEKCQIEISP
jgi:hypothetical protein